MLQDPQEAARIQKRIVELREQTLLDGHAFMIFSEGISDLPAGVSFYEYPDGRFVVEQLTFSEAGDYAMKPLRMATTEEVARIKALYPSLYGSPSSTASYLEALPEN